MTGLRVFFRRLFGRADRDRWEADLDDELRFHLQMEIERHEQAGLSTDEARREAFRGIGGVEVTKEAILASIIPLLLKGGANTNMHDDYPRCRRSSSQFP